MLRGIRVKTKQELIDRIYLYFDEVNKEPVVYHWTYKMDERFHQKKLHATTNYLFFNVLVKFINSISKFDRVQSVLF